MPHIETILIIMASLTALAVMLQIVSLIVMAVIARKAVKEAKAYAEEYRTVLTPLLQHARDLIQVTKHLIERIEPRVEAAASDLAEIARIANEESRKIRASADEINDRVRRQAERMDSMATSALNGVERVGRFLNEAVNAPVRQVSGILAAAKAIVETLRGPAPAQRRARPEDPAKTETGQYA
ncbi:MAG TPA: hypothetical protein VKB38_13415 [Terracidiphilus sp.]|nr:hypothetical protein [Terracidiphilus sp.]